MRKILKYGFIAVVSCFCSCGFDCDSIEKIDGVYYQKKVSGYRIYKTELMPINKDTVQKYCNCN